MKHNKKPSFTFYGIIIAIIIILVITYTSLDKIAEIPNKELKKDSVTILHEQNDSILSELSKSYVENKKKEYQYKLDLLKKDSLYVVLKTKYDTLSKKYYILDDKYYNLKIKK